MGSYTAIIKRDGDWWIGWVEEVPGVNAQERTREELLASLRMVLTEAESSEEQTFGDSETL
jgi:predicted RNase H-like HicB family nuclease